MRNASYTEKAAIYKNGLNFPLSFLDRRHELRKCINCIILQFVQNASSYKHLHLSTWNASSLLQFFSLVTPITYMLGWCHFHLKERNMYHKWSTRWQCRKIWSMSSDSLHTSSIYYVGWFLFSGGFLVWDSHCVKLLTWTVLLMVCWSSIGAVMRNCSGSPLMKLTILSLPWQN